MRVRIYDLHWERCEFQTQGSDGYVGYTRHQDGSWEEWLVPSHIRCAKGAKAWIQRKVRENGLLRLTR